MMPLKISRKSERNGVRLSVSPTRNGRTYESPARTHAPGNPIKRDKSGSHPIGGTARKCKNLLNRIAVSTQRLRWDCQHLLLVLPFSTVSLHRAWPVVLAIVFFALLMAVRHELSSIAGRAAIAAIAFATLALALLHTQQRR